MFYFNCLHLSSVQCASFGRFFCFGLAFGKTHINAFAAQIVFPQIGIFRIHRTCVSRARAQSSANEFDRWRESIYFIFIFVRFWIGLWMMVRCYSVGAHSTHWNVEIKSSMFVNGKLFYIAPICNFWWQAITFPCDLVRKRNEFAGSKHSFIPVKCFADGRIEKNISCNFSIRLETVSTGFWRSAVGFAAGRT